MDNSSKNHLRQKVQDLVKEFVCSEVERGGEIPPKIADYLLKNYGWTSEDLKTGEITNYDDIDEFVEKLESFIMVKYKSCYEKDSNSDEANRKKDEFLQACDKLKQAEDENFQVHLETIKTLVTLITLKIEYSKYLKNKSSMDLLKVSNLEKQLELLKLQPLSKLYGEEKTYEALLVLKNLLEEEKRQLEITHDKLVQQNADYEKLKDNREYRELLKTYKELLKEEKMLDSMNDI